MLKNLLSFKEYFTGQLNAEKKKSKKVKKEYANATMAGQRGPGLGNFRPIASLKKSEGTALHSYLVSQGILKK
tara:strand:+ start:501 stop:719 length:219 start_codon:yes stop_codon:yes gene_type:complete